jgi:hypothetical protein
MLEILNSPPERRPVSHWDQVRVVVEVKPGGAVLETIDNFDLRVWPCFQQGALQRIRHALVRGAVATGNRENENSGRQLEIPSAPSAS